MPRMTVDPTARYPLPIPIRVSESLLPELVQSIRFIEDSSPEGKMVALLINGFCVEFNPAHLLPTAVPWKHTQPQWAHIYNMVDTIVANERQAIMTACKDNRRIAIDYTSPRGAQG